MAEISGRGIVAFDAESDAAAPARLADCAIWRYLYVFQSGGRALWDGASEVRLRTAKATEVEAWQANRIMVGRSEESPGYWRAFLVPIVNPLKFEEDSD